MVCHLAVSEAMAPHPYPPGGEAELYIQYLRAPTFSWDGAVQGLWPMLWY